MVNQFTAAVVMLVIGNEIVDSANSGILTSVNR